MQTATMLLLLRSHFFRYATLHQHRQGHRWYQGFRAASLPHDGQVIEVVSALAQLAAEGTVISYICDVGSLDQALCQLCMSVIMISLNSFCLLFQHVSLNWPNTFKSFDWSDRHGIHRCGTTWLSRCL